MRCFADISAINQDNKAKHLIIVCNTFAQYCTKPTYTTYTLLLHKNPSNANWLHISSDALPLESCMKYISKIKFYNCFTISNFTVCGNANFRMTQTTFTMVGFTQPQAALPIIEDIQNNAKGFTSCILWIFPEPVFCRMKDSQLTAGESERIKEFQELSTYL